MSRAEGSGPALRERGLSVIVPMFNEAVTLPAVVPHLVRALDSLGADWELVLVDDGSADETAGVARRLTAGDPRVRVVSYRRNSGKGKAVKRGFEATSKGLVLTIDADLLTSPEVVLDYVRRMEETGADVVAANKWHRDSSNGYDGRRFFLSHSFNVLVRVLFGLPLRDTQCGFKLYKREVLASCLPMVVADRFAFEVELLGLARRRHFRMTGAPIRVEEARGREHSRVNAVEVLKMFKDVVLIFPRVVVADGRPISLTWKGRRGRFRRFFARRRRAPQPEAAGAK